MPIRQLTPGLLPYIGVLGLFLFLTVFSDLYTIDDRLGVDPEGDGLCVQGLCPDNGESQTDEGRSILPEAVVRGPADFMDVTDSAGIEFLHHPNESDLLQIAAGVVVFDFDGFQDIYLVDSVGPNALYRNNGDETFTDVAVAAGVDEPAAPGNGACAADYDGDGDRDLFITNYGPNRLFRNEGDGTFVDVSVPAGIHDPDTSLRSTGCAWGDYNLDGFLDLIVVRHLDESDPDLLDTREFTKAVRGLVLYRNGGDGTLADVTDLLGDVSVSAVAGQRGAAGALWGAGFQPGWTDFDNDGDLDLYVVNDFGAWVQRNVLWRNDGIGTDGNWRFLDVSESSEADIRMFGMGLALGDYDLDGDLDFFMTNIGNNVLLRNDGPGATFTDVKYEARVGKALVGGKIRVTWGAGFLDYDNDGDEDLYVVSGYLKGALPLTGDEDDRANQPLEQPNILLQNRGDGSFADASLGSGADDPGIGRGSAYLDFNNDGCLDLFVSNYGQRARLLRNRCESGNNWLVVRTVGSSANRDGIGARITVDAGGRKQIREVSSGSSHMSQDMAESHFGMGSASTAETVTVRWPSGEVQTLTKVATNRKLTVVEPR